MTVYQRALANGNTIFYREAGAKDAPAILLLHGFPTSSHMFRNLIPVLAERYHVIAPDVPGFGFSDALDRKMFRYTSKTSRMSSIASRRRSASIATPSTYSTTEHL